MFSAIDPVAEPATEFAQESGVAQGSTVPWPVFAGAAATIGPETDTAAITSGPEQITVLAGSASAGTPRLISPRAIAVESTRRTGELSFAPRERSDAPSAQPTWSQAVRLTRQAVCAWVDLLAGPPRVEVTAR